MITGKRKLDDSVDPLSLITPDQWIALQNDAKPRRNNNSSKAASPVWFYFRTSADPRLSNYSLCYLCHSNKVVGKNAWISCSGGSTSTMASHLRSQTHHSQRAEIETHFASSEFSFAAEKEGMKKHLLAAQNKSQQTFDQGKANELQAKAWSAGLLPPALCDIPEFREWIDYISSSVGYQFPKRTKTTCLIDSLSERIETKIKKSLHRASSVALTTDAASTCTRDHYVAVTGTWIERTPISSTDSSHQSKNHWVLKNAVLALSFANHVHTAERIKEILVECVDGRYQLQEKQIVDSITTDNGANFVKALKDMMKDGLIEENPACICHTVNLIVRSAYEPTLANKPVWPARDIVSRFKEIAHDVKNSKEASEKLKRLQKDAIAAKKAAEAAAAAEAVVAPAAGGDDAEVIGLDDLPDQVEAEPVPAPAQENDDDVDELMSRPLKIVTENATRWHSCYDMLDRMLTLKPFLLLVFQQYRFKSELPSADDWDNAEALRNLLRPLKIMSRTFEGQNYVTMSAVSSYLSIINFGYSGDEIPRNWNFMNIERWDQLPAPIFQVFQELKRGFSRRFESNSHLLTDASLVDPQFKSLRWLGERDRNVAIELFRAELVNVAKDRWAKDRAAAAAAVNDEAADVADVPRRRARIDRGIDDIFNFDDDHVNQAAVPLRIPIDEDAHVRQVVNQELTSYLSNSSFGQLRDRNPDYNVLNWWSDHETLFPTVAILALKYLAIPASSAPSERVFSQLKIIMDRKRHNMVPARVQRVVLNRCNRSWVADDGSDDDVDDDDA